MSSHASEPTPPADSGRARTRGLGVRSMKVLRHLLILCVYLATADRAVAQDYKARISESPAIERIREFYSKFSKFGVTQEQEIQAGGETFFTLLISDSDGQQVFFWAYQKKGAKWVLLVDEATGHCVWSFSRRCFIALSKDGEVIREYKPS